MLITPNLTDIFIIAITLHRLEPRSLTFKASKGAYGIKFLRSLYAQWLNGMSCTVNSLLIPIQLCGGKKTKHPRYNNVSRMFLSFSLAFNAIPRYGYYRTRKIFRNQLSYKQKLPSPLIIICSTTPSCV